MRKSKEERLIEHGDEVLKELYKVYLEGIGIDEYYKLLKEYKKLYRRYEKIIKLSDNMGSEVMGQNESLNDNLQYTIKTARNKLLENVKEHRKTKEAYTTYKERIVLYDEALKESYAQNAKLERRLNSYIKHFGEINHTFNLSLSSSSQSKLDLNQQEYKECDISKVVSLELAKNKENFVLAKVKLDNFSEMREVIESNSSINNFITGIHRYLRNIFNGTHDVIFHQDLETFYVIIKDRKKDSVDELLKGLNKKRKVFSFLITFTVGATTYKDSSDNVDIFIKRCNSAFDEAFEKNQIVFK